MNLSLKIILYLTLLTLLTNFVSLSSGSPYYYMNGSQSNQNQGNIDGNSEVMSRSPLAATRANSGASASSPTDSACQEKPQMSSAGMFIGWQQDVSRWNQENRKLSLNQISENEKDG